METEDAAILTADLPGCKNGDVDAQISDDGGTKTLTIKAVRKKLVPPPSKNSTGPSSPDTDTDTDASELDGRTANPSSERSTTAAAAAGAPVAGKETTPASSSSSAASPSYKEENFQLSFTVGDGIDVSGIHGSLEDGVLTLVLPKLAPEPPAEPIEIPIGFAAGSKSRGLEGGGRSAASIGRTGVAGEASSAAEADTHISLS